MLSPFPGMNPYLEHPDLWSEVHHRLITAIAIAIESDLSQRYRVAIEKRTYLDEGEESVLVGIPDVAVYTQRSLQTQLPSTATLPAQAKGVTVTLPMPEEIREGYLEIRAVETGSVITVIEVLSPKNKRAGVGRQTYERKRRRVLSSPTHLVEIDLLRAGEPMRLLSPLPQADYRILISQADHRPQAQLYPFTVRQAMPQVQLPLQANDPEPIIDLQGLFAQIYQQARFEMAIDYHREPVPPLGVEDGVWADALLRDQGRR
jgi:hypothetical protein